MDNILREFQTISLEEMGEVKLMNRIDSKFVTHINLIIELLKLVRNDYLIQEIDGEVNLPYHTCYYDTSDNNMFYQHQRGKKTRQKIRLRTYETGDSGSFLEIKSKNNKGRTKKKRVRIEEGDEISVYSEFLSSHTEYSSQDLVPVIENHFYRITLVNHDKTERITIDTFLEFHNLTNNEKISLPEIGIIEWKRDGRDKKSPLKKFLNELRIHEGGFSKYCIGMAMTDGSLKQNRLKTKIRKISKIIGS